VLSGNGTPGSGSFSASFAVQGGTSLAVQMSRGIQYSDLAAPVLGTTTTLPFYKPSDTVFAGNFQDPITGAADGYSKLAAYGLNNGQYRFLFQSESGAYTQIASASGVAFPAGLPVAGDFDGNASAGSEVGIFTGTAWDLYSITLLQSGTTTGAGTAANPYTGTATFIRTVPWSAIGGPQGSPVAGDFNGDGLTDLAVWSNGKFYISFAADNFAEIDATIPLNFSGTNARPIAADIEGEGIDDLGLWIPASPPSTTAPATWYFVQPSTVPIGSTTTFTAVDYQFESSVGVPLTGIFTAATSGGATPAIAKAASATPAKAAAPLAPTSVTVNGTAGNDSVQLVAGQLPDTWALTVNGKSQTIGSSVTTLNLNGLGGTNQLSILGTGKSETAQMWPTETIFHSGDLTVTATNFSQTTVNGGKGGNDSVLFHDVLGKCSFVAAAGDSSLTGANYSAVALNFAAAVAVSSPGEGSVANFHESSSAAAITDSKASLVVDLSDLGIVAESAFFSKVQIYNAAGNLVETIVPGSSAGSAAYQFSATTLSPARSVSLKAAAALAAQNNKKSGPMSLPLLVDAVMASYAP
jgi:hypothetical protein